MTVSRTITIRGATDTGRVRGHNEDAILIDARCGMALVADGMGGHASGEVASRIAVETFAQKTASVTPLRDTLLQAHAAITAWAETHPESAGMGATAVAALADAEHFQIAWVGDSRAYHWCRGELRQVSRDHSYLQFLLSRGEVTPEAARNHPQRNVVTQALGLNLPEPETLDQGWQPGDRLLLCSDGLSDELDDGQIEALLTANADIEEAVFALMAAALNSGGRDNISVAILENAGIKATRPMRSLRYWMLGAAALAGIALWLR